MLAPSHPFGILTRDCAYNLCYFCWFVLQKLEFVNLCWFVGWDTGLPNFRVSPPSIQNFDLKIDTGYWLGLICTANFKFFLTQGSRYNNSKFVISRPHSGFWFEKHTNCLWFVLIYATNFKFLTITPWLFVLFVRLYHIPNYVQKSSIFYL